MINKESENIEQCIFIVVELRLLITYFIFQQDC